MQKIQNRDGTTTVILDHYAEFGEIGGVRSIPEPSEAERERERRADQMSTRELSQVLGTPAERIDEWRKYGLPPAEGRRGITWAAWTIGEPYWSRRRVMAWLEEFKAFADRLR